MNDRDIGGDDHFPYEGELAAYLLDALSAEEAAQFERHLATCERCQSQARWLEGAVDVLPESVQQLEPPPELRERLLEEVRASSPRQEKRQKSERRFDLRALVLRPAVGYAMACVAIAAIAGYAIGTSGGGGSAGSSTIAASATPAEPSARATVVRDGDSGMLKVERLTPQPRGKVYELWMRSGDELKSASLFVVRPDGSGEAAMPSGLDAADELMVTLEPEHGSATPTTQPVLRAEV